MKDMLKKRLTWLFLFGLISTQTRAQIDDRATPQTKALYNNLHKSAQTGFLLGHQDALAYGVGWKYKPRKSDVYSVVGDYPALYGWDLGYIENDSPVNLDSVPFDKMKQYIREGYERGGVITISWHGNNPLNDKSAWDVTPNSVQSILPGGPQHAKFLTWLDKIAAFLHDLKGKNGAPIPVLFRPYHELTGNWFWWGSSTCTPQEFKDLFRFTVHYFKDEKQLHNLIYVYNTSQTKDTTAFLERYPGDDVVDVLSFDAYQYDDPTTSSKFQTEVLQNVKDIYQLAQTRHKIIAIAETGYEQIPYAQWWTKTLLPAIGNYPVSYVLLWRNAGVMPGNKMHYYMPYPKHASAPDFKRFVQSPKVLLERDAKALKLYK
ncbi:mannan endo-1,4-beta-mannosidase [Chitinophaga skermanii]|uniref:Mannan endo-1,4-beta-mannosidase n=1 Tax=Chitinophaga skermanii TaxID=331697 RepID=A0A327QY59_9BACT|nr:glycosyl hydrolase [Chitinophaga skermanii]RAJ08552.1 mannan endo-1,4-beta-mannosidase [Chitinophaga skermanii]